MQHKIVLDVKVRGNLSDSAQDESASLVFSMLNDFCAIVRQKTGTPIDVTMFSSPTNPVIGSNKVEKAQDYCTHAFEIMESTDSDVTYVRCVKCGSKFALDDAIPEGSHRHMLNIELDTGEITCDRCQDEFDTNPDSSHATCAHQLLVDIGKKVAFCPICEALYDVDSLGEVELEKEDGVMD